MLEAPNLDPDMGFGCLPATQLAVASDCDFDCLPGQGHLFINDICQRSHGLSPI